MGSVPTPELSRRVSVGQIPPRGLTLPVEATDQERAALCKRFDLLDLPTLRAQLTIRPSGRNRFVAKGWLCAEVSQKCVVSLDPVDSRIDETVAFAFEPHADDPEPKAARAEDARADDVFDTEEDDPPEPIHDGAMEVGEPLAQLLYLALDPYPRRTDAECPDSARPQAPAVEHPFTKLARRKRS